MLRDHRRRAGYGRGAGGAWRATTGLAATMVTMSTRTPSSQSAPDDSTPHPGRPSPIRPPTILSALSTSTSLAHPLRPMSARDPQEPRTATTLELLYDLTLVVAFGVAGTQAAHALASGHAAVAVVGFAFSQFAVIWAWMSYSGFASSFDTDDWGVRLGVGTQMLGVLVLTVGLPELFAGLEHHWTLDNGTMVAGYVVMRLSMLIFWGRAARANPDLRSTCTAHAVTIVLAQTMWVLLSVLGVQGMTFLVLGLVAVGLDVSGPALVRHVWDEVPWHPHHIAERYGLITIITLGEVVVGTAESVSVLHLAHGWAPSTVLVLFSGTSITLGLWWTYFSFDFGGLLHAAPGRIISFCYAHILLLPAITAAGAGLHVAALRAEGEAEVSLVVTVASIAVPLTVFLGVLNLLAIRLGGREVWTPLARLTLILTVAGATSVVVLAAVGAPFEVCLAAVVLLPWVNVAAVELTGGRFLPQPAS